MSRIFVQSLLASQYSCDWNTAKVVFHQEDDSDYWSHSLIPRMLKRHFISKYPMSFMMGRSNARFKKHHGVYEIY